MGNPLSHSWQYWVCGQSCWRTLSWLFWFWFWLFSPVSLWAVWCLVACPYPFFYDCSHHPGMIDSSGTCLGIISSSQVALSIPGFTLQDPSTDFFCEGSHLWPGCWQGFSTYFSAEGGTTSSPVDVTLAVTCHCPHSKAFYPEGLQLPS